jgi:hypothetical protein
MSVIDLLAQKRDLLVRDPEGHENESPCAEYEEYVKGGVKPGHWGGVKVGQ